jgi:TRAP-type C4-dicarboxylate transport system permease small subunit
MKVDLKKKNNNADGLDRFEKINNILGDAFAWVSGTALVALVLLSAVDMVAHKLFPTKWLFAGAFEVSGLLAVLIASFAIPFTQLVHGHTDIDFFVNKLPKRAQTILAFVFTFFTLALFAVMTWQMTDFARGVQLSGRVSQLEEIPLAPLAYAAAVCFLLMCSVVLAALIRLGKGERK